MFCLRYKVSLGQYLDHSTILGNDSQYALNGIVSFDRKRKRAIVC